MSQVKTFSWTNANPAIARDLDVGFTVAEITVIDVTNGGSWQWISGMGNGFYLDVDAGTVGSSDGFTVLSDNAEFGASITGFTEATPGVISANASEVSALGFAAGDTVKVSSLADDGTGTSLNGTFTVASVSGTDITLVEDTSSGYATYVSGGFVSRVSDTNGTPISTENVAIRGITVGTNAVGAASASMVAIAKGAENVT